MESYFSHVSNGQHWKVIPVRSLRVCTGKLSRTGLLWSALESYPVQVCHGLHWKAIPHTTKLPLPSRADSYGRDNAEDTVLPVLSCQLEDGLMTRERACSSVGHAPLNSLFPPLLLSPHPVTLTACQEEVAVSDWVLLPRFSLSVFFYDLILLWQWARDDIKKIKKKNQNKTKFVDSE